MAARGSGGGWLDTPDSPQRKVSAGSSANRAAYLGYQTALSTYVYGFGLPLGLGVDETRVLVSLPLITAPLAFGAHLASSPRLDFTESHLKGTIYAPAFAVYSTTALALAFTPNVGDGYRIGSLLGTASYPIGLWYGHHLGDAYSTNPSRLDSKMLFALGYGFVGFITPILYFESPGKNSEDILRTGLGQSVGLAMVGHVVADRYRAGGVTGSGVPLGMATHTVLGGLGGVAAAAYADATASSVRPWLGAAIVGSTLGFTESVYFFSDSRDSQERSQFSVLGGLGGAMMGLGLQILTHDEDRSVRGQKIAWASFLVGGAWVGYWATYALTGHMTETASHNPEPRGTAGLASASAPSRWEVNPLPHPEMVMSRGEPASRWKVPGVTYRF